MVKGHPKPSISWTKKGEEAIIADGPTLKFENPLAENQGTYCVQVTWAFTSFPEIPFFEVANGVGEGEKQEFTVNIRGQVQEKELMLDENEYAICGRLKKGVTGAEIVQVEFKLIDEDEVDEGWKMQEFTVPANETTFKLSLKELRGIQDGREYDLRIRYFQRWYLAEKTS